MDQWSKCTATRMFWLGTFRFWIEDRVSQEKAVTTWLMDERKVRSVGLAFA